MRKIKSAPANICEMVNRKKILPDKESIKESIPILQFYKKENIKVKNKTIKLSIPGLINDVFSESLKFCSHEIGYDENLIIDFINNFINKKFTRKNAEIFLLSILFRFIITQTYHELLIQIKENILLLK
jgi:hypothetical protein